MVYEVTVRYISNQALDKTEQARLADSLEKQVDTFAMLTEHRIHVESVATNRLDHLASKSPFATN
mgnify:CR=1 FL=1